MRIYAIQSDCLICIKQYNGNESCNKERTNEPQSAVRKKREKRSKRKILRNISADKILFLFIWRKCENVKEQSAMYSGFSFSTSQHIDVYQFNDVFRWDARQPLKLRFLFSSFLSVSVAVSHQGLHGTYNLHVFIRRESTHVSTYLRSSVRILFTFWDQMNE